MNLKTSLSFLLILLASFFTSFDIFLNFNIAGFSIRFVQIILLIPICLILLKVLKNSQFKPILGGKYIIIWLVFLTIFIYNTTFLTRNISYMLWMIFNVLIIFTMVNVVNTEARALKLFQYYIYSFCLIALFGIIQSVLSLIGVNILTVQWWSNGLARANGFSYEPSYYSTYLIIGWSLVTYLKTTKFSLISSKKLFIFSLILTLAILLSTSRMGIAVVALYVLFYFFKVVLGIFQGRLYKNSLRVVILYGFIFLLPVLFVLTDDSGQYDYLLAGTGIKGTSSHSYDTRNSEFEETFQVFKESPLIGYSLGGIPSARGKLHGYNVINQDQAKQLEGMSVFMEVLAASGALGVIPFLLYLFNLLVKPYRLSKKLEDKEGAKVILGTLVSLIAIMTVLQFNQNISRVYLWYHIGLLSVFYNIYSKKHVSARLVS